MPLGEASPLYEVHLASALSSFFFDAASLAAALLMLVGLYPAVLGSPEGIPALLALLLISPHPPAGRGRAIEE